jgi:hypothetical protein
MPSLINSYIRQVTYCLSEASRYILIHRNGKPLCAVQNINTKASVSVQKHRGAVGGGLVSYLRYLYFLCIVMPNTYCVVHLFCFSWSCVLYVVSFSEFPFLIAPSVFSNVFLLIKGD